ncbi:PHP domain-containing protein [Spongiibacter sp. KMU-158]|uniref:PHP domain-containing protein n=1 Tax=Spongiibacter pelagi TaxID=2760804 RepID=A0A927GW68_9GAMM|nr:PHP domain-containing protein [Spongiibacter pelagi]
MLVDLHCHTTASDGSLSPAELVARAYERGVRLLSITDHDTLGAYDALEFAEQYPDLNIIPGVEFSCNWSGVNVHILGLGVDIEHPALKAAVAEQVEARTERGREIARRLAKKGMPGAHEAVLEMAKGRAVGRPDFARFLVENKHVSSMNDAFDRYLGAGKIGDVKAMWPELGKVVHWIAESGGQAVVAHPMHYKMTNAKLRRMLTEFVAAGGAGIEVCNGRQAEQEVSYLRELCRHFGLRASVGSDFHNPNNWLDLGCEPNLVGSCEPVWARWSAATALGLS